MYTDNLISIYTSFPAVSFDTVLYSIKMDLYNTQNYASRSYELIRKAYEQFVKQSLERLTSHFGDYGSIGSGSYSSKMPSRQLDNPIKYILEQ